MEHFSNDHEGRRNQHENSHKLCDEMEHLVVNLIERQWKVRQKHGQNFRMEGKPLYNKYQYQKKKINPKEQDYENQSPGSEQES